MKLIMAIMGKDDAAMVMDALTDEKFQVTKLATTGGFLKSGNTTLIIGVEDAKVGKAIDIISDYSSKRTQLAPGNVYMNATAALMPPFEVTVGGATIFVLNVDQFEKV